MTVGYWCHIPHRKRFWCDISSIWTQLCLILSWILHSKHPQMMCVIHICNRLKLWESCLFAICNHDSWPTDVRYLTEKVLVPVYPAFEHSCASFYDGFWLKIFKMMCLIHICNGLKRGRALYLQFLTMPVASWCQISHRKSCGVVYPAFEHSYASYIWCILAQNIQNDVFWFTSATVWSVVKAVYFQFITITVASWCQISRIQSFGAIYPAFEHSYASFYDGFWLKISKIMCLIHMCRPFEAWESCLFAISNHDSWPPDVRYLTEKVLV